MAKILWQSEESKYIKRINEQLAEVSKLTVKGLENPLVLAWSKAIRESGLEFSKKGTRYKIRNTKENQKKVEKIQRSIAKYHPQTAGEYKKKIKKELKKEAEKTVKRFFPENDKKQRAYIKRKTSGKEILKRIREHFEATEIESRLQYQYQATDSTEIGDKLSAITLGKSRDDLDTRKLFNEFGRITREYRRTLLNDISDNKKRTNEELFAALEKNPFAEVGEHGILGKSRKRKSKK